jgi:hypothetical protein
VPVLIGVDAGAKTKSAAVVLSKLGRLTIGNRQGKAAYIVSV